MTNRVSRHGLSVDSQLADFIDNKALAGTQIDADKFWAGFADYLIRFRGRNEFLLAKREELQSKIDAWHKERQGADISPSEYQEFLKNIGYIADEPDDFTISTQNVDDEIAAMAGPQLVVPALNDRFVLNAANARWGSLYDALYGTDVLDAPAAQAGGYDEARGAAVIAYARTFLDNTLPGWELALTGGDCPHEYIARDGGIMFTHNGLHIELVVDAEHPIGKNDPLHIADVVMEAALTTIIDLEDSVAAVDGADKTLGYANWLGLMRGDLSASFEKAGQTIARTLEADRVWTAPNGNPLSLHGRSLMFVRNVGHLMTNPAILMPDGSEVFEGQMDAVITSLCALHDLKRLGREGFSNSRKGSIYIVKPKMHGPEECAFTNDLFDAAEDLLGLDRHTIKVGVMDEERRTSANLAACIYAVKHRLAFINTGFLDRTGDEMHTSMQAGAMIRKGAMKTSDWITAYEARNVAIGLKHGLSGKAQIGKGMWAMPDLMGEMMVQKIAHPKTGANTAWVPSPTAATLHAMHYHMVDVFAVQKEKAADATPKLEKLLAIPAAPQGHNWSHSEIAEELENNAQGILGYVVRWVDQGVGCSKVPDYHDIGLMEDRATLRISSQHMANWLLHGVCTASQVDAALLKMAAKVDAQNAGDPLYRPMAAKPDASMAFQAARELVFKGAEQPSGYTEPLLHAWRLKLKAAG